MAATFPIPEQLQGKVSQEAWDAFTAEVAELNSWWDSEGGAGQQDYLDAANQGAGTTGMIDLRQEVDGMPGVTLGDMMVSQGLRTQEEVDAEIARYDSVTGYGGGSSEYNQRLTKIFEKHGIPQAVTDDDGAIFYLNTGLGGDPNARLNMDSVAPGSNENPFTYSIADRRTDGGTSLGDVLSMATTAIMSAVLVPVLGPVVGGKAAAAAIISSASQAVMNGKVDIGQALTSAALTYGGQLLGDYVQGLTEGTGVLTEVKNNLLQFENLITQGNSVAQAALRAGGVSALSQLVTEGSVDPAQALMAAAIAGGGQYFSEIAQAAGMTTEEAQELVGPPEEWAGTDHNGDGVVDDFDYYIEDSIIDANGDGSLSQEEYSIFEDSVAAGEFSFMYESDFSESFDDIDAVDNTDTSNVTVIDVLPPNTGLETLNTQIEAAYQQLDPADFDAWMARNGLTEADLPDSVLADMNPVEDVYGDFEDTPFTDPNSPLFGKSELDIVATTDVQDTYLSQYTGASQEGEYSLVQGDDGRLYVTNGTDAVPYAGTVDGLGFEGVRSSFDANNPLSSMNQNDLNNIAGMSWLDQHLLGSGGQLPGSTTAVPIDNVYFDGAGNINPDALNYDPSRPEQVVDPNAQIVVDEGTIDNVETEFENQEPPMEWSVNIALLPEDVAEVVETGLNTVEIGGTLTAAEAAALANAMESGAITGDTTAIEAAIAGSQGGPEGSDSVESGDAVQDIQGSNLTQWQNNINTLGNAVRNGTATEQQQQFYEKWVAAGSPGTRAEFLAATGQGPTGGQQGQDGANGEEDARTQWQKNKDAILGAVGAGTATEGQQAWYDRWVAAGSPGTQQEFLEASQGSTTPNTGGTGGQNTNTGTGNTNPSNVNGLLTSMIDGKTQNSGSTTGDTGGLTFGHGSSVTTGSGNDNTTGQGGTTNQNGGDVVDDDGVVNNPTVGPGIDPVSPGGPPSNPPVVPGSPPRGGSGGGGSSSGMFSPMYSGVSTNLELLQRSQFPITDYLSGLFSNIGR